MRSGRNQVNGVALTLYGLSLTQLIFRRVSQLIVEGLP